MSDVFPVQIRDAEGVDHAYELKTEAVDRQATLTVTPVAHGPLPEIVVSGPHYWDCSLKLRQALEQVHAQLLCNAARRDVWPSGICCDWMAGLHAYVLPEESPKCREDFELVDTFGPASAEAVTTIADQEAYRDFWDKRHWDLQRVKNLRERGIVE